MNVQIKWSRTLPSFTMFFRSSCRRTSLLQVSRRLFTTLATFLPEVDKETDDYTSRVCRILWQRAVMSCPMAIMRVDLQRRYKMVCGNHEYCIWSSNIFPFLLRKQKVCHKMRPVFAECFLFISQQNKAVAWNTLRSDHLKSVQLFASSCQNNRRKREKFTAV